MVTWSSIREFYALHRREVHRYGIAALLIFSAIGTGRWAAAGLIFLAIPVMYSVDRWGEPWRAHGAQMMKTKPKQQP